MELPDEAAGIWKAAGGGLADGVEGGGESGPVLRVDHGEDDVGLAGQWVAGADGDGDVGGLCGRVAIGPGRDGREDDAAEAPLAEFGEAVAVAVGKNVRFAILSAAPDRADRVEDEARGKAEAFGHAHLARWAGGKRAAGLFQRRPGGIVDRAIHPAAAHQAGIGGIDDHVRLNVEQAAGIEDEAWHGISPSTAQPFAHAKRGVHENERLAPSDL